MQCAPSERRNIVIGHSSPGGGDCVDIGRVGASFVQYTVPLDCTYDNTTVAICIRYISGECVSQTAVYRTMSEYRAS